MLKLIKLSSRNDEFLPILCFVNFISNIIYIMMKKNKVKLKNKQILSIFAISTLAISMPFVALNYANNKKEENDINPKANEKPSPLVAPSTLEELRKMSHDDIIKLKKLDLRDYNLVTSVKNQGAQGICWAYAMAASSEVNMLYKEGTVDASYTGSNFGLSSKNIDRIVNIRTGAYDKLGLTNDDIISRSLGNATVSMFFSGSMLAQQNAPIIGDVNANASPGNSAAWLERMVSVPNNEMEIKKAIANYGSVAFAYKSNGSYTAYYQDKEAIDHATAIVGWDDDFLNERFGPKKPSRNGAWIVKNSWGPGVYENGYFYLSYESKISDIIAFDYANKSKFENMYYYDGLGRLGQSVEIGNKTTAAIFPTLKASYNKVEKLKGVTFGLFGEDAKVKATVYTNVNANPDDRLSSYNNPESGTKIYEQESEVFSNKGRFGGIYTMTFNQELELQPGTYFSIVLEPINKDNSASILFSSEPNSKNDLTFFKQENNEWKNCWVANYGSLECNVASIKALTVTQNKEEAKDNDLQYAQVSSNVSSIPYTDEDIDIELNVQYEDKKLVKGVDYDVEYLRVFENLEHSKYEETGNKVGTLKVTVKGKGIYKGEKSIYIGFTKGTKPSKALGEFKDAYNQQANKITFETTSNPNSNINNFQDVKLPTGFAFVENKALTQGLNTNKVKYVGADANLFETILFDAEVTLYVNINNAISNYTIEDQYYTGQEIEPSINLQLNNVPLQLGQDYFLNYKSNINAGQAIIEVVGNKNKWFVESGLIKFNILKAKNQIIKWEINSDNQFVFESQFGQTEVQYKYFKDEQCLEQLNEKPTAEGTYYVKAFIPGTENYEQMESQPLKYVIGSNPPTPPVDPNPDPTPPNNDGKFKLSTLNIVLLSTLPILGILIVVLVPLFSKKRK